MDWRDKWYLRVLRRYVIIFLCGGVAAVIEALRGVQSPEYAAYVGALIAFLASVDKFIRDHSDETGEKEPRILSKVKGDSSKSISRSFPVTKEEEHDLDRLGEKPGIRIISRARREP